MSASGRLLKLDKISGLPLYASSFMAICYSIEKLGGQWYAQ